MKIAIIGGGAAGFMAAITAAEHNPNHSVIIYEATDQPLDKVRISGGGRCNVTHNCFDPAELVQNYPRGQKELRGPFSRFQPRDTIEWFRNRGVELHAEADGRMFPITNTSQTIIDCLLNTAQKLDIRLCLNSRVLEISHSKNNFELHFADNNTVAADSILIATGSAHQGYRFAESVGHTITACVPSLFTFKINNPRLSNLSGLSFEQVTANLVSESKTFTQSGPLLITHWGLSGPAILKLSAFAARELHEQKYKAKLNLNFLPHLTPAELTDQFISWKIEHGRKQLKSVHPREIPTRYWQQLLSVNEIPEQTTWANFDKQSMNRIITELTHAEFDIRGKGIFKEEFVTCGGVALNEIDFKSMQSRIVKKLYFAGEILDIDGITGGFNFQNAWTNGWLAGTAISLQ